MKAHLRYLRYVLRHKWFVLVAGLRLGGVPLWRLLIHDWSKFTPAEWGPYVRHFYAPKPVPTYGDARHFGGLSPEQCARIIAQRQAAFDRAWLHHQHANPHHWQYWLLREDNPRTRYVMQSHDGGITGNHIVRGEDASRHPRVELDLPTLDMPADSDGARYRLASQLIRDANAAPQILPMPEHFASEMVADWMGAGRAITGRWEAAEWYRKNAAKIQLDPGTRRRVEAVLGLPCTGRAA